MSENPYLPPRELAGSGARAALEEERRTHRRTELVIRTSGALLFFWGLLMAVGSIFVYWHRREDFEGANTTELLTIAFYLGANFLQIIGGRELWRLMPRGRIMGLFSAAALVPLGVGGIVSGLALAGLLLGRKGTHVLSPEYRAVVEGPPKTGD